MPADGEGVRFLTMRQVLERVPLSKTYIYQLINEGTFPRPVPLGPHRVAFVESEVVAWMAARLAAREAGEGAGARRDLARRSVAARWGAAVT